MLTLGYKPSFIRELQELPPALQEEALGKIALFRGDPFLKSLRTHKLKGALKGRWSFSVNYRFRIVFRFEGKHTATLLTIGTHSVYE